MADQERQSGAGYGQFHRRVLESKSGMLALFTTVAILIGGVAEIIPMFTASMGPQQASWVSPYTPLEVAGRDIYIREGCYLCHSQMIRPTRAEVLRYGEWTRAAEYAYDHPFLLGSRRLGPDLQRVGGKYPDAWHYDHMEDPRSTSPGSVMPPYAWLLRDRIDPDDVAASLKALSRVGVPYSAQEIADVSRSLETQGGEIVQRLAQAGRETSWDAEIVALIAYLQRLGQDGRRELSRSDRESSPVADARPGEEAAE